jgi:preprotein translocase subunit SecD
VATRLLLVAVAVLALGTGCGDDDGPAAPSTTASREPGALDARPVLASGPEQDCRGGDADQLLDRPHGGGSSCYTLGPAPAEEITLESATSGLDQSGEQWQVSPVFTAEGIEVFNELAATCFAREPECPTGRLAIVVGDEVVSAPTLQQASFERDQIVITGNFTQEDAEALAEALGG